MLAGSVIGVSLLGLYIYDVQILKEWYYKIHMDYIIIFLCGLYG